MLGLSPDYFDDNAKEKQFVDNITAEFGHMLVFIRNTQSCQIWYFFIS